MAGFWKGTATIVTDDGAETRVDAELTLEGHRDHNGWGGTLQADPADDLGAVLRSGEPHLSMPDGTRRSFALRADPDPGSGRLSITGHGAPPF